MLKMEAFVLYTQGRQSQGPCLKDKILYFDNYFPHIHHLSLEATIFILRVAQYGLAPSPSPACSVSFNPFILAVAIDDFYIYSTLSVLTKRCILLIIIYPSILFAVVNWLVLNVSAMSLPSVFRRKKTWAPRAHPQSSSSSRRRGNRSRRRRPRLFQTSVRLAPVAATAAFLVKKRRKAA